MSGTYFESCNCDAICPCRRIDGIPGGRSTHGLCLGVLSWVIHEGAADGESNVRTDTSCPAFFAAFSAFAGNDYTCSRNRKFHSSWTIDRFLFFD